MPGRGIYKSAGTTEMDGRGEKEGKGKGRPGSKERGARYPLTLNAKMDGGPASQKAILLKGTVSYSVRLLTLEYNKAEGNTPCYHGRAKAKTKGKRAKRQRQKQKQKQRGKGKKQKAKVQSKRRKQKAKWQRGGFARVTLRLPKCRGEKLPPQKRENSHDGNAGRGAAESLFLFGQRNQPRNRYQ